MSNKDNSRYLFRGKCTNDGEWVYGYYDESNGTSYINYSKTIEKYGKSLNVTRSKEVILGTVGQYTGLTDKNGTKIFEGDIIKTQPFYDRPYSDKRKSKQFLGVVKFKTATFKGNETYNTQIYKAGWDVEFLEGFGKYVHSSWSDFWDCEVIDNIHDNPELLKGGADNA